MGGGGGWGGVYSHQLTLDVFFITVATSAHTISNCVLPAVNKDKGDFGENDDDAR